MMDKKQKPLTSFQYYNDVVNRMSSRVLEQEPSDIMEAFLIDTESKNLPLEDFFSKEEGDAVTKTTETLQILEKYYQQLYQVFKQLHSESVRTIKTD